jgi:recombination protein RecT
MEKDTRLKVVHNHITTMIEQKIEAMPKDFNKTRFIQNAMTVLKENESKIANMKPDSVARTILKGAFLGLDFFQKECYAIPYGNELQFQTDYKGEKKIAKKYSIRPIQDIYAKIVRDGDMFDEVIMNGQQSLNFKPLAFNDGEIKGAFAVVLFKDGGMMYETMSKKEVDAVRTGYSKQSTGQAWTKSYSEMCKKTVLRRLCKHIEIDFESFEQAKTYEEAADVEFKKKREIIKPTSSLDVIEEDDYIDIKVEEEEQEKKGDLNAGKETMQTKDSEQLGLK